MNKMSLSQLKEKPHWSQSSINCWLQCSLKYFFRYIAKIESETTSSNLVFGSAIHRALDMMADRKMKGQSAKQNEIRDFYSLEWNNQLACAKKIDLESKEEQDALHDKGLEMIDVYLKEWKDKNIIGHAEAFSIEMHGLSKPVIGEYDLLVEDGTGNVTIVDWKTAARKWDEEKPHKDNQATLYCLAWKQDKGKAPKFRFDVLTKTKVPSVQMLNTERKEDDFNRLTKVFQQVERGINAGVFIPCESFMCSSCEYAKACESWGKCKKAA